MTVSTNNTVDNTINSAETPQELTSNLNSMDALSQYLKSAAGIRQGRAIPPLEQWHPEQVVDMDLVIKANCEWWHEGGHMTRESLVNLFATILWKEEQEGVIEYFLKTPVQKLRIQVEDVPLLINDVGIVTEDNINWLEFTTTTGDVVRLDDMHPITLRAYQPNASASNSNRAQVDKSESKTKLQAEAQVRPYMPIRNGLTALIGRNAFYHLTEIGELTEQNGETILTLQSGGHSYPLSMPLS